MGFMDNDWLTPSVDSRFKFVKVATIQHQDQHKSIRATIPTEPESVDLVVKQIYKYRA